MNLRELKAERIKQNKDVRYMARIIGKSCSSYQKKERGEIGFSPTEMTAIAVDFGMSFSLFNKVFFDEKLPFSKSVEALVS